MYPLGLHLEFSEGALAALDLKYFLVPYYNRQ